MQLSQKLHVLVCDGSTRAMPKVNLVLQRAIGNLQENEIAAVSSLLEKIDIETRRQAIKTARTLDAVDPLVAQVIVTSGLKDGNPTDDVIQVSKKSWPAISLKPSQTTMIAYKVIGQALEMLKTNKIGGDLGALVSSDNQIMDGHHRWASTILASGKVGKVGGYAASLPGKELLALLNLLTKGAFGVRQGKAGTGDISDLTPSNIKALLKQYVNDGIGGTHPWSAAEVRKTLVSAFGSVEKGIDTLSENASLIPKKVPTWAPERKQMPIIRPEQVPQAVSIMKRGEIDWKVPFAK